MIVLTDIALIAALQTIGHVLKDIRESEERRGCVEFSFDIPEHDFAKIRRAFYADEMKVAARRYARSISDLKGLIKDVLRERKEENDHKEATE